MSVAAMADNRLLKEAPATVPDGEPAGVVLPDGVEVECSGPGSAAQELGEFAEHGAQTLGRQSIGSRRIVAAS